MVVSGGALCDLIIPKIESEATNKRKLVHSTVDYLKGKEEIHFRADGGMFLPVKPKSDGL